MSYTPVDGGRVGHGEEVRLGAELHRGEAEARGGLHLGELADRAGEVGAHARVAPARRAHHEVAAEGPVDALVDRRLDRGAHHREDRDDRDPDHQRGGGARGAGAGCAPRSPGPGGRSCPGGGPAAAPRMRPAGRAATGPKTTRPTIISTEPRPLSAEGAVAVAGHPGRAPAAHPGSGDDRADHGPPGRAAGPVERRPPASPPAAGCASPGWPGGTRPRRSPPCRRPAGRRSRVVEMTRPLAGTAKPRAVNPAFRPAPMAMPRPRPTTDATAPTTRVSAIVARSTWRRLAPIARSSADSRLRCATMIEKVLRDAERGDQQGDAGEDHERRAEHVEELGADVVRLLLR